MLGSILLLHELDLPALIGFLGHHGIELRKDQPRRPAKPLSEAILSRIEEANRDLSERTEGAVDLGSLAFVGLVGLGTAQIFRGQVLSPAATLFQIAMSSLQWSRKR